MSSSSRSCVRCLKPVLEESASGLCAQCERKTSKESGTPASANPDQTRSQAPGEFGPTLTAGFTVGSAANAAHHRPAPPGYDLFRYLGGGGMGEVWLAREHVAQRVVAIKFLRVACSPTVWDRFLNEVRALGRIDHPNVVRIITPELSRTDPYYTMEFAAGGTLAERLKEDGPFEPKIAAQIVAKLAEATSAAHETNVLHRDIKPSNVVVMDDGTPKLSDFGLAKLLDEQDELTRTTQAVGTPAFMPPEQISRKFGEFGPHTDVYGLGATLYAMLTGKAPFEGDTQEDVLSKVKTEIPSRPQKLRPELPRELDVIVMKCLEKRPADRYPSADALAKDLKKYCGGERPDAAIGERAKRAWRWAGRNRVAIAAGVFLAAILGLAPIAYNRLTAETGDDRVGEIQRELAAGRTVTLIGATGLPRWFDRPIAGVEIGTSIAANDACAVSSVGQGVVVLHPGLGIDRYELEGEFQETGFVNRGVNVYAEQWAGLMFGYDVQNLPAGERLHTFVGVTFRDFQRGSPQEMARLGVSIVSERPGKNPEHVLGGSGPFKLFAPAETLPGPWRTIKFVIEPKRIQAFWKNDDGKFERFADWDERAIATRIASVQQTMRLNAPPINGTVPEWSSRRGVALWCVRSSFAVKNVTVTPLDPHP